MSTNNQDNKKQKVIKDLQGILDYAREDYSYTLYNLYNDLFDYLKTLLVINK